MQRINGQALAKCRTHTHYKTGRNEATSSLTIINNIKIRTAWALKMLIQYDLPTKKTPNNIHECSA